MEGLWISDFRVIVPIGISILALIVSFFALRLNIRNYRAQSYYQNGSYKIFLVELSWLDNFLSRYCFKAKVTKSSGSNSYTFPYHIAISPNVGGVERAQFFEIIPDGGINLGIRKTIPIIKKNFKKFNFINKQYAHAQIISFGGSEKHPYFYNSYNHSESKTSLSRYHFCIEITDFKNNTEIWYVSFSLILNKDKGNDVINGKFDDFTIVSPKDLIKNINEVTNFNTSLEDISKKDDINQVKYELQLFEMKEYLNFLSKVKAYL